LPVNRNICWRKSPWPTMKSGPRKSLDLFILSALESRHFLDFCEKLSSNVKSHDGHWIKTVKGIAIRPSAGFFRARTRAKRIFSCFTIRKCAGDLSTKNHYVVTRTLTLKYVDTALEGRVSWGSPIGTSL
jgi:hypothetical protein